MSFRTERRWFAWAGCLVGSFLLISIVGCGFDSTPGPALNVSNFEADLASGQLVLVKFGAKWCGPCRMVDEELDKLSGNGLAVKIIEVDIDANRKLASQYNVSSIPNLFLIRNKEILESRLGFMSANELSDWIQTYETADIPDAT